MLSQSMTNKQISLLFRRNPNLCEINKEYPSLKQSSTPRHLSTCTKSLTIPEHINTDKLSTKITCEHHAKDPNKPSKHIKEEVEIIELFQYKQEEEIKNKLYRKSRYQPTYSNNDDDEKRDNTN